MPKIEKEYHDFVIKAERKQQLQIAQNAKEQFISGQNTMKPGLTKYNAQQAIQNKSFSQYEKYPSQKHNIPGGISDQIAKISLMNQDNPNQPSNYPPFNKASEDYTNKFQKTENIIPIDSNKKLQKSFNDSYTMKTSIANNNINEDNNNFNDLNILYGVDDNKYGKINEKNKDYMAENGLLNKDNRNKLTVKRKTSVDIREFENKIVKKKFAVDIHHLK